jgi:hypothetical protein
VGVARRAASLSGMRKPRLLPATRRPLPLAAVTGGVAVDNVDTQTVDRSGFLDSGPSDANRIIERHELLGNQGAF